MKNLNDIRYVFRVSTDLKRGSGHISRLLALRSFLDGAVAWFTDPKGVFEIEKSIPAGDKIYEEESVFSAKKATDYAINLNIKVLVCDSYFLSPNSLNVYSAKVIFFEDKIGTGYPRNFTVVNCQPKAKKNSNYCSGPEYTPIDTKSKIQIEINFIDLSKPIKCLIGFGSLDSVNRTCLALEALLSDSVLKKMISPVCLVGKHFKFKRLVKEHLRLFEDAMIISDCDSVLDVPITCPIAIGAPGLSHAERLFSGSATVLIPQNYKHQSLCRAWVDEDCALLAKPEINNIVLKVHEMISNNFEKAENISRRGQELIDGKGASRIAERIMAD